jgi:hypothetical protein
MQRREAQRVLRRDGIGDARQALRRMGGRRKAFGDCQRGAVVLSSSFTFLI